MLMIRVTVMVLGLVGCSLTFCLAKTDVSQNDKRDLGILCVCVSLKLTTMNMDALEMLPRYIIV